MKIGEQWLQTKSQSGLRETQDGHLVLPSSLAKPLLVFALTLVHLRKTNLVLSGLRPPLSGRFEHLQLDFVQLPLTVGYQNVDVFPI